MPKAAVIFGPTCEIKINGKQTSQYVAFQLGQQTYGINVREAVEVIRMVSMAEPPEAPPFVMGLVNIRGQVVPIIDMRLRLGMKPADYTLATPILIVKVKSWIVGLIVDKISEVLTFSAGSIEPYSDAFSQSRCVVGVAKIGAQLMFLLDMSALFSSGDALLLEKLFTSNKVNKKVLA